MDMVHAPELARGLLESSGASLQHLQLAMGDQAFAGLLWEELWRASRACTELTTISLIFVTADDEEVASKKTLHIALPDYGRLLLHIFGLWHTRLAGRLHVPTV